MGCSERENMGNDVVSWSMKLFNGLRRIKKSKMNDGKTFHWKNKGDK